MKEGKHVELVGRNSIRIGHEEEERMVFKIKTPIGNGTIRENKTCNQKTETCSTTKNGHKHLGYGGRAVAEGGS